MAPNPISPTDFFTGSTRCGSHEAPRVFHFESIYFPLHGRNPVSVILRIQTVAQINRSTQYYAPVRSFIICFLIACLPFVVVRELTGLTAEAAVLWLANTFETFGSDWAARFCERLVNEPFKLFLAGMNLVVIFFGFVQYLGLRGDLAVMRKLSDSGAICKPSIWTRFMHRISGRPKHFLSTNDYEQNSKSIWRAHRVFGENALMAPLRFSLTAFPMLGFLGTVVGLSGAIRHLPNAMKNDTALQSVMDNLYIAFDTTFLGLAGALGTLIFIKFLEMFWERIALMAENSTVEETAIALMAEHSSVEETAHEEL